MYVVDINTKQVLTQLENVFPYVWSNDGKRIIYAFGDKIFYETGWQDYSNTLYIMSAQDWTSQVLLDTEWSVWRLYWSPVEDKILAQVDDDGPDGSGAKSLYIIELNGTVRKLPVEVDYSTWSADGRKVIYSISKKLEGEIRQINIDGTQDEIVVKIPGSIVSEPKLSPSGEWLAYRSYKMLEPNAIFLLNNWNKELIQVSPNGVNSASYSWSSNGKYLAYLQSQKNQELGCSLHIFSLETLESVKIIENLVYCYDPVWQP
jgi:Tol biopolymer transport system component